MVVKNSNISFFFPPMTHLKAINKKSEIVRILKAINGVQRIYPIVSCLAKLVGSYACADNTKLWSNMVILAFKGRKGSQVM